MVPRRLAVPLAATLALGAVALGPSRGGPVTIAVAFAKAPDASSAPKVALLATRPGAAHSTLHLVRPGDTTAPAAVATLPHLEDGVVRAATLPASDAVIAVAETEATRDLSFNAGAFLVAPHAPPVKLCDRVVHASRPLVTAAGRVFVSRGVAGPEQPGAARADDLTIDEVDAATGKTRVVHAFSGYLGFLAGALGREVLVYRIAPAGADVVAVDADTGKTRVVLASLLPYARDFSVDPASKALLFTERDESKSREWVVDRLDLATGARARLARGSSMALSPFALPGGRVLWSPEGKDGLHALAGPLPKLSGPLGDGADVVSSISPDGAFLTGLHAPPGRLAEPFVLSLADGRAARLAAPPGARIAVAGFATGGSR